MPASRTTNFHKLFSSLLRMAKSASDENLADLEDALGVPVDQDIGNDPHHRPSSTDLNVGNPQSMSGDGASKMVREFGDFRPGDDLTQAYAALADDLQDVKAAVKAISNVLSAAFGKSGFPQSEEEEREESEEKEAAKARKLAAKGRDALSLQIVSVPQLMASLMDTSRTAAPAALAQPPSFSPAIAKASSIEAAVDDLHGPDRIAALGLIQHMHAMADGRVSRESWERRLAGAPLSVRSIFQG